MPFNNAAVPSMTQLLAMSFDGSVSPSITLRPLPRRVWPGWGFAWYPGDRSAASIVKDPRARGDTELTAVLRDWDRFRSSIFLCHVGGSDTVRTMENTQPLRRSFGGRDWSIIHNGNLDPVRARKLDVGNSPAFQPVGKTDTEHAFCWLLNQANSMGLNTPSEIGYPRLHDWLRQLNAIGALNLVLSDGHDVIVYRDEDGFNSLWATRQLPPHEHPELENEALRVCMDDPSDCNRTLTMFATEPLGEGWLRIPPGVMIVVRRGSLVYTSDHAFGDMLMQPHPGPIGSNPSNTPPEVTLQGQIATAGPTDASTLVQAQASQMPVDAPGFVTFPVARAREAVENRHEALRRRELIVTHETVYTYETPVEKSVSLMRLSPVHDVRQELLEYTLEVSVTGTRHDYEDVFGNTTTRLEVDAPYGELRFVARSRLIVSEEAELHTPFTPDSLPLVWMPWQRQMMVPYLLPPELPESQLEELTEYANSFAERQDYDLVATILDINSTLRRDFAYVSHSTHLGTTPFDVYVNRRGVCQDFANLFICLARLLNIPARYRVGYIHTGSDYSNQIQSEASHAWVELYLPTLGWRGFDPTNGCLAGLDHVRVAAGRNYRDATPTSGTIFKGGGREMLSVSVKVEDAPAPSTSRSSSN